MSDWILIVGILWIALQVGVVLFMMGADGREIPVRKDAGRMAGITHWWDVAQHVFAPSPGDPRKCVHCLCDRYDHIHKTCARPLTWETGSGTFN